MASIEVTYERVSVAKSISSAGYATLFSDKALDFSETGLTAYVAKADGSNVKFEAVTTVPANTGVMLKGAEGNYSIPVVASASAVEDNLFEGVLEATAKDAGIFVLMNGTSGVGFYKTANAFTVGANTAYLPASVAKGRMFIGFEDTPTGINEVKGNAKSNVFYNLNGQRVATPNKGLYIVNGKKVMMK